MPRRQPLCALMAVVLSVGATELVPLPYVVCVQVVSQPAKFEGFYAEQAPAETRAQQIGASGWDDRSPVSPKIFRFVPVHNIKEAWVEAFVEDSTPCQRITTTPSGSIRR